jgi:catechol 2,3-dioxygenase-like lactoylglutathione lyase family enzyme
MSDAVTPMADLDQKLEVVVIPVSDVDRATEFYVKLEWRQDLTPPGVTQLTPAYMVAEQSGAELPT